MIIGNGLFARAFAHYKNNDNIIIFASGVSNSKEKDPNAYEREKTLLQSTILKYPNKKIIYFSTTSIYDLELENKSYCQHKIEMENIIQKSSVNYTIFRLSEVAGPHANKSQILAFLASSILEEKHIPVWKNASRHLIDIDDVKKICSHIIDNNQHKHQILTIASPIKSKILNLIFLLENVLKKKAKYTLINKGQDYDIDIRAINIYLETLQIQFNENYVQNLIQKYYQRNKDESYSKK